MAALTARIDRVDMASEWRLEFIRGLRPKASTVHWSRCVINMREGGTPGFWLVFRLRSSNDGRDMGDNASKRAC